MAENLEETLLGEIAELLEDSDETAMRYRERIAKGNVTRDEDPATHLCVYFAAIDPEKKKVFIAHHKKSGLWMFTGGHLDKGETFRQAVEREIGEEWGLEANMLSIGKPEFLTITPITNFNHPCKAHYDVWHFVRVDMDTFRPDPYKLAAEARETRWLTLDEAREITTDDVVLSGYDFIEKKIFAE